MALCRAVIPSSFAALGFGTCVAVFRTNSNSPSRLASRSRAKGSKLTLLANFTFCVPLDRRLLLATDSFDSFFSELAEDMDEMDEDLLCSELFEETSSLAALTAILSVSSLAESRVLPSSLGGFSSAVSISGKRNEGGISILRDKYGFIDELMAMPEPAAAAAPAEALSLGCSCRGCFLIVRGFALIGRCGSGAEEEMAGVFSSIIASNDLFSTLCLLITLTMVGIELADFDFWTIAGGTREEPLEPFCKVSVSELWGLDEETLLLGFGGRAGRGLLSALPFVCELLGATICTILGTILGIIVEEVVAELVVVTVVGATLLMGFLGGTAIVPIGPGDFSFSEDELKDNLVGF